MKLKITRAKSAGFCFGVKRAIEIALKAAGQHLTIEMLGDIVHNQDVCRQITASGVKKIKTLKKGQNKTLLVRAHGIPLKALKEAKKLGYKIIDATCPMVKEIHKVAVRMEREGRRVIVIGDKNHAEVQGIVGHLKSTVLIIENQRNLPLSAIKKIKKAGLVVQSTQNTEKVADICELLRNYIPDLKCFNTICTPTRKKQSEIRSLAIKNGLMVIIGSKASANTRRLYEISKSLNRRTYWVQSSKDLKKIWLKGVVKIGVAAGASTPDYTTQEIIKQIRTLTKAGW
ncbi:MAG: 4-hydroxy-3-methylbut-2-enyl diphosphate reductase [Candidatus Omnitrophota bacterium]